MLLEKIVGWKLNLGRQRDAVSSLACIRWSVGVRSARNPALSQRTREKGRAPAILAEKGWASPPLQTTVLCKVLPIDLIVWEERDS